MKRFLIVLLLLLPTSALADTIAWKYQGTGTSLFGGAPVSFSMEYTRDTSKPTFRFGSDALILSEQIVALSASLEFGAERFGATLATLDFFDRAKAGAGFGPSQFSVVSQDAVNPNPNDLSHYELRFGGSTPVFLQINDTISDNGATGFRWTAVIGDGFPPDGDQAFLQTGSRMMTAPIPEPSTFILLGSGLLGLIAWKLRKGGER